MAKNSIQDYDVTASLNLDVGGVSIAENCAPANVNDAIRGVMGHLATLCGSITQAEMDQLQTIGTTTISATQWGYVGAFNQALTTTSNVDFGNITTSGAITLPNNIQLSGNTSLISSLQGTGANLRLRFLTDSGTLRGGIYASAGGIALLSETSEINVSTLGSVATLAYASSAKLETNTGGVAVTGEVNATGNIIGSTDNVSVAVSTSIVRNTHANRLITSTAAGAITMTVNSTSGTYQAGDVIVFVQSGAGQITLAAGAGYTMRTPANRAATSRVQYSQITITFISATEFVIGGDLTVV